MNLFPDKENKKIFVDGLVCYVPRSVGHAPKNFRLNKIEVVFGDELLSELSGF